MKLSSKTDCALRAVIDLALHTKDGHASATAIARRQNISRDYLGQILLTLKTAGIVTSKRGLEGGYLLARAASEIGLLSLVELTDPSLLAATAPPDSGAASTEMDIIKDIWADATEHMASVFEEITIQDVCDRIVAAKNGQAANYTI